MIDKKTDAETIPVGFRDQVVESLYNKHCSLVQQRAEELAKKMGCKGELCLAEKDILKKRCLTLEQCGLQIKELQDDEREKIIQKKRKNNPKIPFPNHRFRLEKNLNQKGNL